MDRPWFRKWAGFSYIPISWQGWVATALVLLIFPPLSLGFLLLSDTQPLLGWVCGGLGTLAAVSFFGIVVWKLERDYGE